MRNQLYTVMVVLAATSNTLAKIFEKCELASLLEKKYDMTRDELKNWVCIAQYESTFNSEAINHANWDGSKDYGLFQLNNKYWCGDDYGKNECKLPCSKLVDDDITDDLACVKEIVRQTESWKGKGTGLTAWVAYVNRCENRNLDEYMAECWSDPFESNIINTKDEDESPQEPESTTENGDSAGGSETEDSPIINLVRVPIMFQRFPYFQHLVNPYGFIYQQTYD